jgi:hypothetical protein
MFGLGCSESSFDNIRYGSHDVRTISSVPQDPERSPEIIDEDLTLLDSMREASSDLNEETRKSEGFDQVERPDERLLVSETNRRTRGSVRPILKCVERVGLNHWIAHFGYWNTYSDARMLRMGARNKFTPSPKDRGQPESFEPGRHLDVFQVIFDGAPLIWTLGDLRSRRDVTASRHSPRCRDAEGEDDAVDDAEGEDDTVDDTEGEDDECEDEPPSRCITEELVIVSDTQSTANGHPAALTYDQNPRWTAEIGYGARWIWDEELEPHPQCDRTVEIDRAFTIDEGQRIGNATIRMAGDNSYQCLFNNQLIFGSAIETGYFNENVIEIDLSAVVREGENTLHCEVTNWGFPSANAYRNPGGLIFAIVIETFPEEQLCDGVDNDCDGEVDEGDICEPLLGYHGGFEWVSVPRNSRWDIYEDPDLAGWSVSWLNPNACEDHRAPVLEIQGYGLCTGGEGEIEGNQHAELDSDCQGPRGGRGEERTTVRIERAILMVAGQRYRVSFYARSRYRASGSQTIYAEWNGTSLIEEPTEGSWTEYVFEVVAVDHETILAFADLGDANTLGVLLDDIEVTPIP